MGAGHPQFAENPELERAREHPGGEAREARWTAHDLARRKRVGRRRKRHERRNPGRAERAHETEQETVGATLTPVRELGGGQRARRHFVTRTREERRQRAGEVREVGRTLLYEKLARAPTPFRGARRRGKRAEPEALQSFRCKTIEQPLRDAGRSPRTGFGPRLQDDPRHAAEVERLRTGARRVQTRAEPANVGEIALKRAERRQKIGCLLDRDFVEKRGAAGGIRIAPKNEAGAARLRRHRAGAIGMGGLERTWHERQKR